DTRCGTEVHVGRGAICLPKTRHSVYSGSRTQRKPLTSRRGNAMTLSIRPAHVVASLCAALLATLPMVPELAPIGAAAPAPLEQTREKEPEVVVPNVEVRFTDGGVMKVKILDAEVPLKTPYGKLVIPIDQITEIECAWRLHQAVAKRIKSAIARLDSESSRDRDAASAELEKLGLKAYPALLQAEKSDVAEVRRRGRPLREKSPHSVPPRERDRGAPRR